MYFINDYIMDICLNNIKNNFSKTGGWDIVS